MACVPLEYDNYIYNYIYIYMYVCILFKVPIGPVSAYSMHSY